MFRMGEGPAQARTRGLACQSLSAKLRMNVIADLEQPATLYRLERQSCIAREATRGCDFNDPKTKSMKCVVFLVPLDPRCQFLRLRMLRIEPPGIRIRKYRKQGGSIGLLVLAEPKAVAYRQRLVHRQFVRPTLWCFTDGASRPVQARLCILSSASRII